LFLLYWGSLLSYHNHTPAHSLCSSNTNLLSVPRVHTTFASRDFSVTAPSVWNSLPSGIRACSSPHTFRRLLKTHCFDQAFSSPMRLTQVPQIWLLADTAHFKGFYLLTYWLSYFCFMHLLWIFYFSSTINGTALNSLQSFIVLKSVKCQ